MTHLSELVNVIASLEQQAREYNKTTDFLVMTKRTICALEDALIADQKLTAPATADVLVQGCVGAFMGIPIMAMDTEGSVMAKAVELRDKGKQVVIVTAGEEDYGRFQVSGLSPEEVRSDYTPINTNPRRREARNIRTRITARRRANG